ncbi:IS256 family transposase ISCysp27 [Nitrosospira sp. NRS527]|nr:IS256 family transposase ISCysp27 [Nitrosospira sp. NRS527]
MSKDNVLALKNPGIASKVSDVLMQVLRDGAQQMLVRAIEVEVTEFLERYRFDMDEAGQARMVRNGYLPERTIQTGLGEVGIEAPRVRDRASKIWFTSAILPSYLRRTKTMEELLPWLYLKGISTGDFSEALASLLGPGCAGIGRGHDQPIKSGLAK